MFITLHVPKGQHGMRDFIRNEIGEASNIKSKQTKKSVISGLRKILNSLPDIGCGNSYYTDGNEFIIEKYHGIKKIYFCGKEYKPIKVETVFDKIAVVIDADECTIAEINNDLVNVLWSDQSLVPRKHACGGQSAQRFNRARKEYLKRWLRECSDKLFNLYRNRVVIVGGPGMTKDLFVKELHSYIKVIDTQHCGYTNENGIYELLKRERYVNI